MDTKDTIIVFTSIFILCLIVISYAESKQITSIYTYEGFTQK